MKKLASIFMLAFMLSFAVTVLPLATVSYADESGGAD